MPSGNYASRFFGIETAKSYGLDRLIMINEINERYHKLYCEEILLDIVEYMKSQSILEWRYFELKRKKVLFLLSSQKESDLNIICHDIYKISCENICWRDIQTTYMKMFNEFNISDVRLSTILNTLYPSLNVRDYQYRIKKVLKIPTKNKENDLEFICKRINAITLIRNEKNEYKKLELLFESLPNNILEKYSKTIEYMKKYAVYVLGLRKKTVNASSLFFTFHNLLSVLDKEIFDFTKNDFLQLANRISRFSENVKQDVIHFIKYLNTKYKQEFANNVSINFSSTYKNNKLEKDDFYTEEEWQEFANNVLNIDRHIENAYAKEMYSFCWLYLILHLCLAWRKSDILSIPNLEMLDVKKYTLDYFCKNEFTLVEATEILNDIRPAIETYYTEKTNEPKEFLVPQSIAIPIAIAIIIAQRWCSTNHYQMIFGGKNIKIITLKTHFGFAFSNRKANRTLLTLLHQKALYTENISVSYVASVARSHKINPTTGVGSKTTVYLSTTYDAREYKDAPLQLMQQGAFGWLYKIILELIDDVNLDTRAAVTESILELKKLFNPSQVDEFTDVLLKEYKSRNEVIDEFIQCPKGKLKEKLFSICSGNMVSKMKGVTCAKTEQCTHPLLMDCFLCKYGIPTAMTITDIKEAMLDVANQINEIPDEYIADIMKLNAIFQKLLILLLEARNAFGDDYVGAYISYEKLKELFLEIRPKFLLVGDGEK